MFRYTSSIDFSILLLFFNVVVVFLFSMLLISIEDIKTMKKKHMELWVENLQQNTLHTLGQQPPPRIVTPTLHII